MKEHSSWRAVAIGTLLTLTSILVIAAFAVAAFTQVEALEHPVLHNLGLALIAALIAWLAQRHYSRSRNIVTRTRFTGIVGGNAALESVSLVYPAFEIDPDLLKGASAAHREYRYIKRRSVYGHRRADLPVVAAENDMRAIVTMSNLLGEQGSSSVSVRMDGDFVTQGTRGSFISFGLSSNECTHHYLGGCRIVGEEPLFSITEVDGEEVIRLIDGSELSVETSEHYKSHPGLFVKYIPKTSDPDTCWMFIMGMGAPATPGVCYWLRDNWQDLGRLIAATGAREFVAVFYTEASAEASTRLSRFLPVGHRRRNLATAIAGRKHKRLVDKYVRT